MKRDEFIIILMCDFFDKKLPLSPRKFLSAAVKLTSCRTDTCEKEKILLTWKLCEFNEISPNVVDIFFICVDFLFELFRVSHFRFPDFS